MVEMTKGGEHPKTKLHKMHWPSSFDLEHHVRAPHVRAREYSVEFIVHKQQVASGIPAFFS